MGSDMLELVDPLINDDLRFAAFANHRASKYICMKGSIEKLILALSQTNPG